MEKPTIRRVGVCVGHSLKTRPMEFYHPVEVDAYIAQLEKRAEAAEAALEVEKDIHDDTMQAMHLWCERAKEAEAKLAEYEKQERKPSYFLNRIESSDKWWPEVELRIYESQLDACKSKDDHGGGIIELFTRPAPAADLAEMCDRQYIAGLQAGFRLGDAGDNEGLLKATANYRQQIIDNRKATTPAADLADLVPDKLPMNIPFAGHRIHNGGWNGCIDAILRNIEEAKK